MIKVLHVINWLRRGGVETQLLEILKIYDSEKFHIDVCCFGNENGYLAPEAIKHGAKIFNCPKSPNLYQFSKRFSNLLRENQYDIVHCHSEAWSGAILRGAKQAGVPVRIAHIRSSMPQGFKIQNRLKKIARNIVIYWGRIWLLQNATHIFGVSASALNARFPGWEEQITFSLWTLGIDTEKFSKKSITEKSLKSNPLIISVGSFIPQRRQDLLIRIQSIISNQFPESKLLLVGEGECFNQCKDLAGRLKMNNHIEFAGLKNNIPELLHSADLFITASEVEGMPNALLEAQSVGLPVVASDIPPHREAVAEIAKPFLFKSGDTKLAAQHVSQILSDKILYQNLSEAGHKNILFNYNASTSIQRLQEQYEKWITYVTN